MGNQRSSTISKIGHVLLALIIGISVSGAWSFAQHNRSYADEVTNKALVNADFSYLQQNYGFWDIVEEATNGNFRCLFQIETGNWFAFKLDDSGVPTDEFINGTIPNYDPAGFGFSSKVKAEQYWPEGCIELMHDVDGSTYPEACLKEAYEVWYQDIVTVPGETYEWSFMLAGYGINSNSSHFLIGAPGKEREQPGTVIKQNSSNGGTIYMNCTFFSTGTSHAENDNAKNFVTFGGTYTVPEGQTITRLYPRVSSVSFDDNHWPIGNYVKGIEFAPQRPWIEVSSSEGGTISNAGKKVQFNYGDEVIFTLTPDEGYRLSDLLLDDKSVFLDVKGNNVAGETLTYTTKDLDTWATLQAVFSEESEEDNGTGTDDPGNDPGTGGDDDGNGSGTGEGDGTGTGNGDGTNDDGTGTGSGEGDGTGDGTGNGEDDNTGDGNGDETGDGIGDGTGTGDGEGDGSGVVDDGNNGDGTGDDGGNNDNGDGNDDGNGNGTDNGTGNGTNNGGNDDTGINGGDSSNPDFGLSTDDDLLGSIKDPSDQNPGDGFGDNANNNGEDDFLPSDDGGDGYVDGTLDVSLIDDATPNATNYGSGSLAKAGDSFLGAFLDAGPGTMALGSLLASAIYLLIVRAIRSRAL